MLDSQALTAPFVAASFKFSAYILAHGLAMLAPVVLRLMKATRIDDCSTLMIFNLFNSVHCLNCLHAMGIHNRSPMQQEVQRYTKAARKRAD